MTQGQLTPHLSMWRGTRWTPDRGQAGPSTVVMGVRDRGLLQIDIHIMIIGEYCYKPYYVNLRAYKDSFHTN